LVGWQEGHPACKKIGGWQRWALVGPDGVAPSRMVGVSASVNLSLHHKVQKFLFWHRLTRVVPEKGIKTVVVVVVCLLTDVSSLGITLDLIILWQILYKPDALKQLKAALSDIILTNRMQAVGIIYSLQAVFTIAYSLSVHFVSRLPACLVA